MPDWLLIGVQAVDGGLFVTAFAVLGEMLQPKRFAGVFGVMLGAPAVLPATLTIIEKREGRGSAVTEMQGAVPGTVALVGFAVTAAAGMKELPLAVSLLAALGAWVVVAIGGYLAQAALMPTWRRDVRDLTWERHDAAQARRGRA